MHLLIIGWTYVVLMMAVTEANSTQGTLLGAIVTALLYGVLPLSIMLYLMATPARRARRRQAELKAASQSPHTPSASCSTNTPDGGSHAAGDAVSTERKEP